MDASAMSFADITVRVSVSEARAQIAWGDALMSATGLSTNSPARTSQSSAFFITPGTPCAYSGDEIRMPSASASWRRKFATLGGAMSPSRSGLKCGRSARPSYNTISSPSGASVTAARSTAVFAEADRKLPEIARTRMGRAACFMSDGLSMVRAIFFPAKVAFRLGIRLVVAAGAGMWMDREGQASES